jgi:hypothetical protein
VLGRPRFPEGNDIWLYDERQTTFLNKKQVSLAPFSPHPLTPDICAFSHLESLGGWEFSFDPFTSGLYRFYFLFNFPLLSSRAFLGAICRVAGCPHTSPDEKSLILYDDDNHACMYGWVGGGGGTGTSDSHKTFLG